MQTGISTSYRRVSNAHKEHGHMSKDNEITLTVWVPKSAERADICYCMGERPTSPGELPPNWNCTRNLGNEGGNWHANKPTAQPLDDSELPDKGATGHHRECGMCRSYRRQHREQLAAACAGSDCRMVEKWLDANGPPKHSRRYWWRGSRNLLPRRGLDNRSNDCRRWRRIADEPGDANRFPAPLIGHHVHQSVEEDPFPRKPCSCSRGASDGRHFDPQNPTHGGRTGPSSSLSRDAPVRYHLPVYAKPQGGLFQRRKERRISEQS